MRGGAMNLPVYLDYASTTPVAPEVQEAMLPFFSQQFGNASSVHSMGLQARAAVEQAREILAGAINAAPEEIVFTSGATESNNTTILETVSARQPGPCRLASTRIEHSSVLEPLRRAADLGGALDWIPVDQEGTVAAEDVEHALRPDTVLVSIMHANNEIGTIQPVAEIGAICRERRVLFHCDAAQTFCKLPIDVRRMNIDMMSLSAHKIYGPKGVGALFVRSGVRLPAFLRGGDQERGRRGGTINVAGIVGFGRATECALSTMQAEGSRLASLRDRLIDGALAAIPLSSLTGSRSNRLANNVHLCIHSIEGEAMLLALDSAGICVSAGSACSAGSTEPSHVLIALGIERERARGAIRLTLGRSTSSEIVDYTIRALAATVAELRSMCGGNG
ncbi:MAG TPA: cysteine desulfurase family protein [Chthonomonadales bacterium]|nr:cysteine desulfurase family protein [Chthonomonadales bacterium]